MGKKVKGKHRLDKYYRLAKEHGYRSRASWKLLELDSKFGFLRSARGVLDLCAAPGGWMQVAVSRAPVGSLVLGLDLVPIAPIRGAISVQQDITNVNECKAKIKRFMAAHGCTAFDVVLHDGAPNVGGAWAQEATKQNALVIDAVRLATQLLAPQGTFVTKVFRSQDFHSVQYCLKKLFEKVEVHKPAASRYASAEIFVLAFKYKAAAKIDPRLLDVNHLFQGSLEPQRKVMDVLRGTKQKRHRDGYEDGQTVLRKVSTASDFIWSGTPHEILCSFSSISFNDPASAPIKDHALTTEEVQILCDDLRVLGEQDYKCLLKWRLSIRKAMSPSVKAEAPPPRDAGNEEEGEERKVLGEMEELTHAMERKKKREKKNLAKRRTKDKSRKALGLQMDAIEDGYVDHELFSLSAIKGKNDLAAVDSTELDDEHGKMDDSENEESQDGSEYDSSSDLDSEEERKRYDKKMEELLDHAYELFVSKKEGSAKQRKRARKAHSEDIELLEGGDDEIIHSDNDSERQNSDNEANPLVVPLLDDNGHGPTQEEITNKWFSQDIFAEAVEDGDLGRFDSEDEMQVHSQEMEQTLPETAIVKRETQAHVASNRAQRPTSQRDDFEIVLAPASDLSDDYSSSDESYEDIDTKAEILACANKMLRKKQREQMIDDAYNKYMFDDEGLPKWFLDEERRHRQPIKPVTREDIAAMKAQFKEIDARPAKKVAEAKARKKRVAMKKLEKVRKKANMISEQTDVSDRSKRKQIEQLYKKATIPKRPQKEYVVAKKGVQVKVGKGKVLVDRRMKKDLRARGTVKAGKCSSKNGKTARGRRVNKSFRKDRKE